MTLKKHHMLKKNQSLKFIGRKSENEIHLMPQ